MPGLGLGSRAIIGRFYETLEGSFDKSWVSKVGMTFGSDQESETYKWLGMSPAMREWVGGRNAKGLRSNGMTITNKTFEATLEIAVDDIRRDKTGQVDVRIGELADRVATHWESLLSTLIANGGGATSGLCYDGQYFFDTDHSEGSSGTLVNACTSSHVAALDVTTAAAPTQAEMASCVLGTIGYMLGYKDDQGEPIHGNARQFLVMTPTNLWGPAMAAASQSTLIGTSGAISPNPLSATGFNITAVCNPRLSTTTVFYVFRTDGRTKPFILQEEEGLSISAIAEGSEEEFKNNRHLYGVKAIRNVGYGMWQHGVQATLS
jgi:phage major head subunit gpT-like protein